MKAKDYNIHNWKDILYYDETYPSFLRWSKNNKSAGCLEKNTGYYRLGYNKELFYAHRIIWLLFYDISDNSLFIDHIDGNKENNKIENLRITSHLLNMRNLSAYSSNTSGITGVSCIKRIVNNSIHSYWIAQWYCPETGKHKNKWFSVNKYGYEEAREMAIDFRKRIIEEANDKDAGYTDRHGY